MPCGRGKALVPVQTVLELQGLVLGLEAWGMELVELLTLLRATTALRCCDLRVERSALWRTVGLRKYGVWVVGPRASGL